LLEVRHVTRRFAGLVAVDDVDFALGQGEILGLIGPNGAGKTTLISLISGTLEPSEGEVLFDGQAITRLPAFRRARLGIGRTFQIMRPFPGLSVLDNVAIGALFGHGAARRNWRGRASRRAPASISSAWAPSSASAPTNWAGRAASAWSWPRRWP
jgi:branched-chain amino acid transport system ATP-binding protein